jgi:hypothetical protein
MMLKAVAEADSVRNITSESAKSEQFKLIVTYTSFRISKSTFIASVYPMNQY